MTTRETIDDFLAQKRLALVGISRQPRHFTRTVYREFEKRGYDMVPVNPQVPELEGHRCFARVQDVTPPVDGVLVMTSPAAAEQVVRDCAEAGVSRVWLHRAHGLGSVTPQAVEFCQTQGIRVVEGECPFMFLPHNGFPHNFHGLVRKILGTYPKAAAAA